ncbi:MAG: methanogenesis marker 9 domain-containing protein [Methanospirillum sp.]|nr:methanogenesis marker 9 domain-containing protein [Methanospirillum sp.]
MADDGERFGLSLNGFRVRTPLALASMGGVVDSAYTLARAAHIGATFLGGYSVDNLTLGAARKMAARGRAEFLPEDPVSTMAREVAALDGSGVVVGLNIRAATPDGYARVARAIGPSVVYEIDAHCRQPEMVTVGAGEALVHRPDALADAVGALAGEGVTVSVKFRAGVADDDREIARRCWEAGAGILHVDLMDMGYPKIRQIRNTVPLMLIANNSITTFDRMREMLSHGADMVSLARGANERTLAGLDAAITRYADEQGWYNSPKQLCRGGDIRALAFCCMPVKACPLIPTLEKIGMSRDRYMAIKQEAVQGTVLEGGAQTCFGSLAWCCKASSPCMFRDMTLQQAGVSKKEYMQAKRQLSAEITREVFARGSGAP